MNKTARLKILHVVFSLAPGGMENGLVNVARRLNPDEFETHVCCLEDSGPFAERLPNPANVLALHKGKRVSPALILRLAKHIAAVDPHVLHTHNLGPLVYTSLATMMGISRAILHGEHGIPVGERAPKYVRQRLFFHKCCKRILTVSNGLRDELIGFGTPARKITVIRNGVDTERFAPTDRRQIRARLNVPEDACVFGIVGRFRASKRHSFIFDAFARISNRFPNAHLLVVGEGGEAHEQVLASAKANPAANRIHFAGFQREPRDYYCAMDALVSASVSEGLSNAILEAMACGVPALANTACGNAELITNGCNGWLVDMRTAEDLASALEQILAAPDKLAQMGRVSRDVALESFPMTGMVDNYAQLYRQIAEKNF